MCCLNGSQLQQFLKVHRALYTSWWLKISCIKPNQRCLDIMLHPPILATVRCCPQQLLERWFASTISCIHDNIANHVVTTLKFVFLQKGSATSWLDSGYSFKALHELVGSRTANLHALIRSTLALFNPSVLLNAAGSGLFVICCWLARNTASQVRTPALLHRVSVWPALTRTFQFYF